MRLELELLEILVNKLSVNYNIKNRCFYIDLPTNDLIDGVTIDVNIFSEIIEKDCDEFRGTFYMNDFGYDISVDFENGLMNNELSITPIVDDEVVEDKENPYIILECGLPLPISMLQLNELHYFREGSNDVLNMFRILRCLCRMDIEEEFVLGYFCEDCDDEQVTDWENNCYLEIMDKWIKDLEDEKALYVSLECTNCESHCSFLKITHIDYIEFRTF